MKHVVLAILLVLCSILTLVFVDALHAVGRYDDGIKAVILRLPYGSTALSVGALLLLRRTTAALAAVAVALALFLPLFVHECLPGLIGLVDPAYRSPYGSDRTAPFVRFDVMGFASLALYLAIVASLFIGRRLRNG